MTIDEALATLKDDMESLEESQLDEWLRRIHDVTYSMVKLVWWFTCENCGHAWLAPYSPYEGLCKPHHCPECHSWNRHGGVNEPWFAKEYVRAHLEQKAMQETK